MSFDKTLLLPCPVLTPTTEEFVHPIEYLSSPAVAEIGAKYGIVKLIPPSGWEPPFLLSQEFQFHTRHQKLSDLGLTTRSRKFFNDNINRFLKMRRKKPVKLYFRVNDSHHGKVYYYDLYVAVESNGGVEKLTSQVWQKINIKFNLPPESTLLLEKYNSCIRSYANFLNNNSNKNFEFPDSDSEEESENCLICGKNNLPTQTLLCDNCNHPFHMKCLLPPLEAVPSGIWYCDKCLIGTGDYGFEEPTDVKYTLPQFSQMCKEFEADFIEKYNRGKPLTTDIIEQKFWKFIDIEKSDLEVKYGADIHNLKPGQISGFPMINTPGILSNNDSSVMSYIKHPWNLTKLPFANGSLLNYIKTSISGMTVPWIYIGSLLSTFCWHVEDHYTLSANYCHFGATKKWYGIPSEYADKFEKLMKDSAPDLFQRQPDLLHQLVTLLSPMELIKNGIPCIYVDQHPNEFVITYPRVYHAGFNCGFNLNEAVNFTLPQWLEHGEKSIDDYRKIKKENVFSHFELVESILQEFNKLKGKINQSHLKLVDSCIKSFEKFYQQQSDLLCKFSQGNLTVKYQPKYYKQRKFEDEQLGNFQQDQETDDEEDDLCDICRTHISYQYCIINNANRDFYKISQGSIKQEAIKSPPITPKIKQEEYFRRISISQLLTPESSPNEGYKSKEYDESVRTIANSESSKQLQDLNNKKTFFDECNEIIALAKENYDKEDEPSQKRQRRSIRQKKMESPPVKAESTPPKRLASKPAGKMTMVQHTSTMDLLNQLDEITLCLKCTVKHCGENGERAPEGSTLVYEKYPWQMKDFLHHCKRNYRDLCT